MDAPYYNLECLSYYMGYSDIAIDRNRYRNNHKVINLLKRKWSEEMVSIINKFIADLKIGKTQGSNKITCLNRYAEWFLLNSDIDIITNFKHFNRNIWYQYITFIKSKEVSNKSKEAYLCCILQFTNWLEVKRPDMISENFGANSNDYRIVKGYESEENLAYEKREYVEKIIKYLMTEYKTENTRELFIKEAVIIAANSGMRISEIENLEYKCGCWDEEEGFYKIILNYEDKVGQVNRPVYLTKDGYYAISRAEKLRAECTVITPKYNDRVGRTFIHLFEYHGVNPLKDQYVSQFLNKIKECLNIRDEDGSLVKGNMHGFRHFYGMTLFRESNYNIGVVRYLLGHRSYNMTMSYLEEEKNKVISGLREESDKKTQTYAGKGLDTIIDLLINKSINRDDIIYNKMMENCIWLRELIANNTLKKLTIGYCLKPCETSRCFKCNKWLIEDSEKDSIIEYINNLFDIICYKISLHNSVQEALNNISIKDDIEDLLILTQELNNLGISIDSIINSFMEDIKR